MMCPVSGPAESNGRAETPEDGAGVLANLPRTRPQRATARRAAARSHDARETPQGNGGSGGRSAGAAGRKKARGAAKPAGRATAKPAKNKAAKPVKTKAARPARATKPAKAARPAKAVKPATASKPAKAATAAKAKPAKAPTARRSRTASPKRPLKAVEEAIPRQGFESPDDRATGAVQPPGGTEFVGTAAEIVSELAKAGISGGERLLRDVLSRLGR
ncbi:MAG: hypothetical protein QOK19_2368 [Solirubrobacteraceae bacterium]|jgi:hypothetical protein|nr:hypothetical protein [Solirubrobacterales bacterium]MEA2216807.1 hypothetical protein [Solirubrobacteraceae bacterium]